MPELGVPTLDMPRPRILGQDDLPIPGISEAKEVLHRSLLAKDDSTRETSSKIRIGVALGRGEAAASGLALPEMVHHRAYLAR